ncbi:MAG: SDR family oxidoreductase, partial [Salinivenus sp.]
MPPSILVTGASDPVGLALLQELSHRRVPVRAFIDDRAQLASVSSPFVSPVEGSLRDPVSLNKALRGIERVFLLSPAGPDQVVLQGNVVEAIQRTR